MEYKLYLGDCLNYMRDCEPNSIDTVICDPPYGLSFMGKDWDHGIPGVAFWQAALRVAKPGAMLLAFGGTRTHHRLMVAIEDAGWEIRDVIMWVYGSGFPKSHDISKGIDKAAGAERDEVGRTRTGIVGGKAFESIPESDKWKPITTPSTSLAQQWDGWGTALKPAYEPIILAMKPLDGTFAQNAGKWGVAGLAIDKGRIEGVKGVPASLSNAGGLGWNTGGDMQRKSQQNGRWPANLILDEEAARLLDEQSGESKPRPVNPENIGVSGSNEKRGIFGMGSVVHSGYYDTTSNVSRFFYCAKASRSEREQGLEETNNSHPTVKPLTLMRYLVRLTSTPTGGVVFDPFMGSGTTGIAAIREGRRFIGCELDADYLEIAKKRIEDAAAQLQLFG